MKLIALLLLSTSLFAAEVDRPKELTKDQFIQMAAERFTKMDTNGDGILSVEERKEHRQKLRENMGQRKSKHGEHKGKKKQRRQQD